MIKLLLGLLFSVSVLGQTESSMPLESTTDESPLSSTIGLSGYQFYNGGFMNTRLSKSLQFHYGIVHTNVDNFKILEVPLILKKQLSSNFKSVFGAKINTSASGGFTTLQLPENSAPQIGISFELGFQYDVNEHIMLEMRYSLPMKQNSLIYPSQMDYSNSTLFRFGSEFRF